MIIKIVKAILIAILIAISFYLCLLAFRMEAYSEAHENDISYISKGITNV